MSKKTLAIIVNVFLPGIGTLMLKKTTIGLIQIFIDLLCIVGMFLTLGFGIIIFGPLGFIKWLWAIISAAT